MICCLNTMVPQFSNHHGAVTSANDVTAFGSLMAITKAYLLADLIDNNGIAAAGNLSNVRISNRWSASLDDQIWFLFTTQQRFSHYNQWCIDCFHDVTAFKLPYTGSKRHSSLSQIAPNSVVGLARLAR